MMWHMAKNNPDLPDLPLRDGADRVAPDPETEHQFERTDTVINRQPGRPAGGSLPSIEGYQIEGVIGRGGMGIVYRARDTRLNRTVALKTVPVARSNRQTRQRIENEARSLAKIDDPGVVRIYEVGYVDDAADPNARTPFIAMEYVPGPSLDLINRGNPIKPKQAAEIVYELAKTLAKCHAQGVVHRDLKPGNVLMASPVEPKLTDFGLARILDEKSRLTKTGEIMGTPAYMAPEQASGVVKNVGAAADIYGLGALLYDLVTGRPPFMAPDPVQTMMQVITREPAPPSTLQPKLPRDLETIILKCLEKKPKHRYETSMDLAVDLRHFLQNKPIAAKPTPTFRKALMWVRRHPAISSLIALSTLLIAAAFAGFSFHINSLQHELDRSQRIINEGRSLSKWLLDDFTRVLQSPRGFTYQRSELADRTQQYLNALLKEAEFDRELKTDLAYAFTRLAELQGQADVGSLGQTEQARENLQQAESILRSLGRLDSTLSQKVQCMVHMQLAGSYLVQQDFQSLQTELDRTRELIDGDSCQLSPTDLLAIRSQLTQMEFEIALAKADTQGMQQATRRLRELADQLIEEDADTSMAILAVFCWARASKQWLESREDPQELLQILNQAREQITKLAGENPSTDAQNLLANLNSDIADIQFRSGNMREALQDYQASLQQWQRQLAADAENHVVIFNVAHNWQNLGETHIMMQQLDAAATALSEAEVFYRRWAEQRNVDPESLPEWGYFQGSWATLYIQQGDLDKARQSLQTKIACIQPLADSNVELRRALGDALMTLGSVESQACVNETGKWAEGLPHQTRESTRRAVASLTQARDHFQGMMDAGDGNRTIQSQRDQCQEVMDVLQRQLAEFEKLDRESQTDF